MRKITKKKNQERKEIESRDAIKRERVDDPELGQDGEESSSTVDGVNGASLERVYHGDGHLVDPE